MTARHEPIQLAASRVTLNQDALQVPNAMWQAPSTVPRSVGARGASAAGRPYPWMVHMSASTTVRDRNAFQDATSD
jgi:hypothetical protein